MFLEFLYFLSAFVIIVILVVSYHKNKKKEEIKKQQRAYELALKENEKISKKGFIVATDTDFFTNIKDLEDFLIAAKVAYEIHNNYYNSRHSDKIFDESCFEKVIVITDKSPDDYYNVIKPAFEEWQNYRLEKEIKGNQRKIQELLKIAKGEKNG